MWQHHFNFRNPPFFDRLKRKQTTINFEQKETKTHNKTKANEAVSKLLNSSNRRGVKPRKQQKKP